MAAERADWTSYALVKTRRDDPASVGAYGGHPRGVRTASWPRCDVCGAPMCHMMQIDAGPHIDLGGFARMSVFICHATGGRCEDWDAFKGSNKVLLHDKADDTLYDGPPTVRVYRRTHLALGQPTDELRLLRDAQQGRATMNDVLRQLRHDKIGGGAVWLQGEATPKQRHGDDSMRLVLQFTTDIVGFDITPGGMGYIFVDPSDPSDEGGWFLWQSGT